MPASWSLAFLLSSQCNRRPSGPVPLCCPTLPSQSPWLPWPWLPPRWPCSLPLGPTAPVLWSLPFWPTFGCTGHPARPALLCHPKRCPLSSSADYFGSERPYSAFRASPSWWVQCRCGRPLATHLNISYREASTHPLVSNIPSLKQQQTARNCLQAHNIIILRHAIATTYHIPSRDGNNDNNYRDDNNECWSQGFGHKRPAFTLPCAMATMTTAATKKTKLLTKPRIHVPLYGSNDDDNSSNEDIEVVNKASCTSARHISHHAQGHMLCVKHRHNNQLEMSNINNQWVQ